MSVVLPPYINKHVENAKKMVLKARVKELKAAKRHEFAQEYTKLCEAYLRDVSPKDCETKG